MAGVPQPSTNGKGNIENLKAKKMRIGGNILNYGFIGVDSFMRIKDGESAPVAVGKALLTNAAFSLIPGGILGATAVMGVAAMPEILNQFDRAGSALNQKKQQFGGNFQETEAQFNLMQQGLANMEAARTHAVRRMANHARGAQRIY